MNMKPRRAFTEILDFIQAGSDLAAKDTSVERVAAAIAELKLAPIDRDRVILVAGTNGKGTTAKTLETLIRKARFSVGLFTSPHMISATERIHSHGYDLTDDEFIAAFELVERLVEKYHLARFETFTLMMAEVFWGGRVRPRVDWAVVEVGVGGRQDPTRAIPHATTVITKIGLDHEALLGSTLAAITREKLGAIEPDGLVVHLPFPTEALSVGTASARASDDSRVPESVIAQARGQLGGEWIEASVFPCRVVGGVEGAMNAMNARRAAANAADAPNSADHPSWRLETPWGEAWLALLGARAAENTSLALTTLNALGFDIPALLPALSELQWPCRMEKFIVGERRVYLSGDHNPQGIESLKEILAWLPYRRIFFIVGVGRNKNIEAMLASLKQVENASITLTVTAFRSSTPAELQAYRDRTDAFSESPLSALNEALARATEEDIVVITGSLYLAGYFRAEFLRSKSDG